MRDLAQGRMNSSYENNAAPREKHATTPCGQLLKEVRATRLPTAGGGGDMSTADFSKIIKSIRRLKAVP
jgi:hypothetical protein